MAVARFVAPRQASPLPEPRGLFTPQATMSTNSSPSYCSPGQALSPMQTSPAPEGYWTAHTWVANACSSTSLPQLTKARSASPTRPGASPLYSGPARSTDQVREVQAHGTCETHKQEPLSCAHKGKTHTWKANGASLPQERIPRSTSPAQRRAISLRSERAQLKCHLNGALSLAESEGKLEGKLAAQKAELEGKLNLEIELEGKLAAQKAELEEHKASSAERNGIQLVDLEFAEQRLSWQLEVAQEALDAAERRTEIQERRMYDMSVAQDLARDTKALRKQSDNLEEKKDLLRQDLANAAQTCQQKLKNAQLELRQELERQAQQLARYRSQLDRDREAREGFWNSHAHQQSQLQNSIAEAEASKAKFASEGAAHKVKMEDEKLRWASERDLVESEIEVEGCKLTEFMAENELLAQRRDNHLRRAENEHSTATEEAIEAQRLLLQARQMQQIVGMEASDVAKRDEKNSGLSMAVAHAKGANDAKCLEIAASIRELQLKELLRKEASQSMQVDLLRQTKESIQQLQIDILQSKVKAAGSQAESKAIQAEMHDAHRTQERGKEQRLTGELQVLRQYLDMMVWERQNSERDLQVVLEELADYKFRALAF